MGVTDGPARPPNLVRGIYNLVFWVFLLPFLTSVEYGIGFIVFTVVIFTRLAANLYVNTLDMQLEQYERFPFRLP